MRNTESRTNPSLALVRFRAPLRHPRPGRVADLTLFDPKTVTGHADYKAGENGLLSTGIPCVIINGTIAVKDSTVLPIKVGKPIRYPAEDEGRFQPASVRKWISERSILSMPYPATPDDSGAGTELQQ